MTTQMKSLVFVAAIAVLPVACGTSGSPTGPEATIETGLSSQRYSPGVPPSEPQVPESDPVPGPGPSDPGPLPAPPEPEPTPKPVSDPSEGSRPPLPSSRPVPPSSPAQPETGADVVPEGVPEASPEAIPAPPVSDPGSIPMPTPPTTAVPPPSSPEPGPVPPTDPNLCAASSIEILSMLRIIAEPPTDQFVAVLRDAAGVVIEDKSCETLKWTADAEGTTGGRMSVVPGQDSRYVTVVGATGPYKLSATAPNGTSVAITAGGGI